MPDPNTRIPEGGNTNDAQAPAHPAISSAGTNPETLLTMDAHPPATREIQPTDAAETRAGETASPHAAGAPLLPVWEQIAGHDVEGELGRGGMGVVYKARHRALNRIVALKMILHADHAGTEERARFLGEAQALARLRHENIVQVYEAGEHVGKPFLSLEYIEGGSLDKRLKESPLPPREAAALVETMARAMQTAHDAGIIHRDLKPANVLLAACGVAGASAAPQAAIPKITDFGLARNVNELGQTQTGAVMGTPSYMAPEQARGQVRELDARADVYALGAILYECLTGRPPFRAASVMETLQQVLSEEPVPPSRLQPGTPRDLETVCLKCLEKAAAKRFQSASELAEELRRFQAGEPIASRPISPVGRAVKWAKRRPLAAALAALTVFTTVAAAAGLAWGVAQVRSQDGLREEYSRTEEARKAEEQAKNEAAIERDRARTQEQVALREKRRADEAAEKLRVREARSLIPASYSAWQQNNPRLAHERLAAVPEDLRHWEWHYLKRSFRPGLFALIGHAKGVLSVAHSPDGKWIASGSADAAVCIWNARSGLELRRLTGHFAAVNCVCFSADSALLATAGADGAVIVWDPRDGRQLRAVEKGRWIIACVAFSPNGQRLAIGRNDGVVLVKDANTGRLIAPAARDAGADLMHVTGLAFTPDGKGLVSSTWEGLVTLTETETGKLLRRFRKGWPEEFPQVTSMALSPDGRWIVEGTGVGGAVIREFSTGRVRREFYGHRGDVSSAAFAPDSIQFATAGRDTLINVWSIFSENSPALTLKGQLQETNSLTYSPDGQRILSGGLDGTVRAWDSERGVHSPEAVHTRFIRHVAFSPDGRRVASAGLDNFIKVCDVETEAVLFSLHGGAEEKMGEANCVEFSPDGNWLASAWTKNRQVRVTDLRTGKDLFARAAHAGSAKCVAFSPDATLLASGGIDKTIRVWRLPGGEEQFTLGPLPDVPESVAFGSGGERLVAGMSGRIFVWEARTGRLLFRIHDPPPSGIARHAKFALGPDGRFLACAGKDGAVDLWDIREEKLLFSLKGHGQSVHCGGFSPDGKRLVSVSGDLTARIWDLETRQELLMFPIDSALYGNIVFSPDRRRLASAGRNSVTIWDAPPDRENAAPNAEELARRERVTRLDLAWHQDRAARFEYLVSQGVQDRGEPAAFHLGQMLREMPWDPDLHMRRGKVLAQLKRTNEAALHFLHAVFLKH